MTNEWLDWGKVAVIVLGFVFGLYFQRRDYVHLDKRIDDLRDSMKQGFAFQEKMIEQRFDAQEQRFDDRFNAIDQRFDAIDQRFDAQEKLFTEKLDRVADVLHARLDSQDERITRLEKP